MICHLCPRNCGAERTEDSPGGVCHEPWLPVAAKAMLHRWEEPCLTGDRGAGCVFFSGCNLRCCFCQNAVISQQGLGKPMTAARLREIFWALDVYKRQQQANPQGGAQAGGQAGGADAGAQGGQYYDADYKVVDEDDQNK